jgi:hypothetical protein
VCPSRSAEAGATASGQWPVPVVSGQWPVVRRSRGGWRLLEFEREWVSGVVSVPFQRWRGWSHGQSGMASGQWVVELELGWGGAGARVREE